ncbi:tautomerase family protein [Methanobacterium aggregans]|uniref:tautomerase family protein n=1 Tax=Methanobacterium aggregans TaxID=1615586 RepID=UPI001AE9BF85|nr:tautomerase family protein [Methanobacterium aggregans]MBP2045631.1 phenylpyruvate tautomerase PptA (4-oxalocrotonate tautomerase family) [Methanobacterium aggregans]
MPLVKVEIIKGKSEEYKKAVLDGVHEALVESIKIPDHDRFQRLYELDNTNFEFPETKTDKVTLIEINMFRGRSAEAKKELYRLINDKLTKNPGIDGNDITVVLLEPPLENWGVRGGKPASEVDLGFNIKV